MSGFVQIKCDHRTDNNKHNFIRTPSTDVNQEAPRADLISVF